MGPHHPPPDRTCLNAGGLGHHGSAPRLTVVQVPYGPDLPPDGGAGSLARPHVVAADRERVHRQLDLDLAVVPGAGPDRCAAGVQGVAA
ncbi:hypothetical protein [Streptomyces sp. HB2AG]|uniref:hypothetical protein n=1 Tax=Streptomyces sp. HB2AG TaxID=2983400 RepID=UPI0022AB1303|nr:hypothetical protein [Streptomyces sp. HB2AG]MCZ2526984.1 hypothetical protein [Streptomyces sp. HB2AG]